MHKPGYLNKHHQQARKYPKRGRSSELIQHRNAKLAVRIFFHTEVKRLRFDDVLNILGDEFFISPGTLYELMKKQDISSRINELYDNRPTLKELEDMSKPFRCDVYPEEAARYKESLS